MIKVTENLGKIHKLLNTAATAAGRSPAAVELLAVSKRQPLQAILELADAGQRQFGENFVQEGIEKISAARRDELTWHFIGHLQSNKTRPVAEHFDWVHTVDRLKIARRLSEHRPPGSAPLNICLQVNIDNEDSKSGAATADVLQLAAAVAELPRLRLRGLMCIPRARDDTEAQRQPFRRLRELFEQLKAAGLELDTLSMGMTADYAAAILEGATMVRIGTALFGPRD
ncbi:MAG: YggS family pyridoxal phosphate-dependent enzyme [Woeseia sp.]